MKRIFVAFDIEHTGNTLLAIGMCVGDESGTVLKKRRANVKVKWPSGEDLGDFETRCWNEFWSRQPAELIQTLQEEAKDLKQSMDTLVSWLDELEREFPAPEYKIKFLSDNPSFDIGNLDHYLKEQCGRRALRYSSTGTYRAVDNPDDMLDVFPKSVVKTETEEIKKVIVHDHNPANDAEYIYRQYLLVLKLKQQYFGSQ